MTQTHILNDDETGITCLPGAARFLATSAAYLAVPSAALSSSDSSGCMDGVNRLVPRNESKPTGARL